MQMESTARAPAGVQAGLRKRPRLHEIMIEGFLFFCGAVSILTTIGIVFALGKESLLLFSHAEFNLVEFFTTTEWVPQIGKFGVLPLLNATLMTSAIAMLLALPVGLGVAIYLSEYASPRARGFLKPILEILAGIPTVVYGYFALTFMTPLLKGVLGDDVVKFYNMASAGLVMGILIIPLVAS